MKRLSDWFKCTYDGRCTDRMHEKASVYIVLLFLICVTIQRLVSHDVESFCTALVPAFFVIGVFALTCSVRLVEARKCSWHLALLSVLAHALPLVYCLRNASSSTAPVHYVISFSLLACVFLVYMISRTWPYARSPRVALFIALVVLLLHKVFGGLKT